jgi:hypothetical protein
LFKVVSQIRSKQNQNNLSSAYSKLKETKFYFLSVSSGLKEKREQTIWVFNSVYSDKKNILSLIRKNIKYSFDSLNFQLPIHLQMTQIYKLLRLVLSNLFSFLLQLFATETFFE